MNFKLTIKVFFTVVNVLVCQFRTDAGNRNDATPYPDRIILNLTQNTSNSISVTWRTDLSVDEGLCELGEITGGRIITENTQLYRAKSTTVKYEFNDEPAITARQHSCELSGLVPGSKYLYRVGNSGHWSEWFEFCVPCTKSDSFSFVYFGDPQNDIKSQWSRVIRKAYNFTPGCTFMLYGGDIINQAGRDLEWQDWFEAGSYIFATIPQVLTPGNHDYNNLQIDSHWKYQFSQPQNGPAMLKGTCFFTDYKNLRIISLDSAVESELEDENGLAFTNQKIWLDSVLTFNTKEWVIVTTHLPFYSAKESRDNHLFRNHFQPILEKHRVDMVLTGHDHSYARGMATENPGLKPSIVYVVSVSGPKLYEAGKKDWMQVKVCNIQLFQKITIDKNNLVFEAFSADGQLFDHFRLKKMKDGKNKLIELNKKIQ